MSSSRMSFRIPTFPSVVALGRRILSLSLLILHPKILSRGVTRHSRRRFIYVPRYIGSREIKFNANVNRFNGCVQSRIESKYLWRQKYSIFFFFFFFLNYEILITFSKYWINKNEIMLTSMAKWINKSRFHANISRERICNTILGEKMVFYSRLNKRSRKYYANNFTRDWSSKIATGRSFLDRRFLTIHVSSEHMSVHQSFRKKDGFVDFHEAVFSSERYSRVDFATINIRFLSFRIDN